MPVTGTVKYEARSFKEQTMPADPVTAGRKGGQSRSAAKIEAAKRNGFQRVYPAQSPQTTTPATSGQPSDGKANS